jgi:formylglycine-generating enzyme required for sulfatase activity/serine/threonine protein kinase
MEKIDKYEVLELIGLGGMGSVYKALHPQFKKYVAIKEIRRDLAADPEVRYRFEREAELLAHLPPHQNIVTVRDALVWNDQLYVVMDYVEGETLADVVREGGVDAERGAELLDQILSGLEAIHRRGIVHRDLKPSNILIDRDGIAYISDFGIAEAVGDGRGAAMATAKCAAPELVDPSLGAGGAPEQLDIYAAGMLAYELLLGEDRFRAAFPEIYNGLPGGVAQRWLDWHTDLSRTAQNLNEIDPDIPIELARVVERMMEKDVNDRYRDAGDARRDLDAAKRAPGARRPAPPADDDATAALPRDRAQRTPPRAAPPPSAPRPAPPRRAAAPPAAPSPPARRPASAPPATAAPQPAAPAQAAPRRPLPQWTWWAVGGGVFVLAVAVLLYFILAEPPGFTVLVKGAPPGSTVFVDGDPRGTSLKDGTIQVSLLKAGTRTVRVAADGKKPFEREIRGRDGEELTLSVPELEDDAAAPSGLPNEIRYRGSTMVLVPEGEFVMGADGQLPNEKPAQKAVVPAFYIDKFEVTNGQYREFCEKTGRPLPTAPVFDPDYFSKSDLPVVGVAWKDAADFAQWSGKRLPTETEWEKAASWNPKTGEKQQWPWGNTFEAGRANVDSQFPTPGGQFAGGASPVGAQDMAGNVVEWVDGYYQPYSGNQTSDPEFGTVNRVLRGGHLRSSREDTRTTRRFWHPPEFTEQEKRDRIFVTGFRCAVSATDSGLQEELSRGAGQM